MNYRDNLEIDFMDLLRYVLKKWRVYVAFMLIGVVLAGCYGAIGTIRGSKAEEESDSLTDVEITQDQLFTDSEMDDIIENVELYMQYKELYRTRKEYVSDSVKINLDPNSIATYRETFLISDYHTEGVEFISDTNEVDNIVELYRRTITSNEVLDEVRRSLGWTTSNRLIQELFTLGKSGVSVMSLSVYGPDENTCKTIAGVLEKHILAKMETICEIQPHELKVLGADYSEENNLSFAEAQKNQIDTLAAIIKAMQGVGTSLSDAQKILYAAMISAVNDENLGGVEPEKNLRTLSEELMSDQAIAQAISEKQGENPVEVISTEEEAKGFDPKIIIMAALLGLILPMLWFCLIYILSSCIKTKDEIPDVFKLPLLGSINPKTDISRPFSGVDRFIDRLFGDKASAFSQEERLDMVSAAITIGAEKEDIKKLYFTGTDTDDTASELADRIKNGIRTDGLEFESGKSPLYDPRSLESLAKADAVVFVEKVGASRYEDIAKLIGLSRKYGVTILGSVVIER